MTPLTREDLLILLAEECGESIQAATKCLRFGWSTNHQKYGINYMKLARELGDLTAIIYAIKNELPEDAITDFHRAFDDKITRATAVKNGQCQCEDCLRTNVTDA